MSKSNYGSIVKNSIRSGWNKTVNYSNRKIQTAKTYARKYKTDIDSAYAYGYTRGWNDAYSYPSRFGSNAVATFGFYRGSSNRRRVDKYNYRYNKYSK